MIKKILLISVLLGSFVVFQTANAHHYSHNNTNYNNSWNYNNSCNGGTYNGYAHWFLRDGQYTQSTKNISNWRAYVSIVCNNWNLSRRILELRCDSWYYRSGNYCKQRSNSHYNNNYNNNQHQHSSTCGHNNYNNNNYNRNSCNAGTYKWYSHWFLRNGQSISSSKNITNWRSYVTVRCRNGNVSRNINSIRCDSWFSRQGNYCRENRNSNSHYNNNSNNSRNNNSNRNSCNSGTYNWYSHRSLRNWQSTHSSKSISHWKAYVTVNCRNGNLSRTVNSIRCDSWYSRQGNYCRERNYTYNR